MATELFQLKSQRRLRVVKFFLSDDWKSKTPWRHNNLDQPYFAKQQEFNDTGSVELTYWYVGPFAILSGKWAGDNA